MKNRYRIVLLAILMWAFSPAALLAQTNDTPAVARAVLFYSPTCAHCHDVITEVITPMMAEYGDRLQIVGIDTTQPGGQQLYQAAIERYQIPESRQGVPTLVIGETVLVGSDEIPEHFPTLVETALAAGGIGWPDIPNLARLIEGPTAPRPTEDSRPTTTPTSIPEPVSAADSSGDQDQAGLVYLAYFFDPSCLQCAQVSANLERLQAQYPIWSSGLLISTNKPRSMRRCAKNMACQMRTA